MTILAIVSYTFAGLVLLLFARLFWPVIVFIVVLAWTLFTGIIVPLIAAVLHFALVACRASARKRVSAAARA